MYARVIGKDQRRHTDKTVSGQLSVWKCHFLQVRCLQILGPGLTYIVVTTKGAVAVKLVTKLHTLRSGSTDKDRTAGASIGIVPGLCVLEMVIQ